MIDEDRNIQLYGYTSDELSPKSHKPVVAVCEECGRYRVVKKQNYRDLCHPCAQLGRTHTPETKVKMAVAQAGRTHTPETRRKMSEMGKNRPPTTDETKGKMSAAHMGPKNHNWKGGISAWRIMLHASRIYKNWRAAVFERDDYTCQMCNNRGGYLEAHHIEPVKDHKNDLMIYDVNNGITLCKRCHLSINNGRHVAYIEHFKMIIGGEYV